MVVSAILVLQISVVNAQTPPSITLNLSVSEVAPESFFEVEVLASSENEINALDMVLEYSPELFSFERAYTARSVVSLWKSLLFEGDKGTISLVGGSVSPWSGNNNEIATLIFRARRVGNASFVIREADFALADGMGTKVVASGESRKVVVSQGASFASSDIPTIPPQIAGASVISDPLTKNPVVVLNTADAGGIKWLGVRSRSWLFWSDWQKAQLTTSIPKYAWIAQIKALGFDGEEVTSTLYRWNIAFIKFIFLTLIFLVLVLIWRRVKPTFNAS